MEKLFDSELKVMDILWAYGSTTAKDIASLLNEQVGWSKTTTYTVIKKCINKGAIQRSDKNFLCTPLLSKEQVREYETKELVNKMFDGSSDLLVASLLNSKNINGEQLQKLRQLVGDKE